MSLITVSPHPRVGPSGTKAAVKASQLNGIQLVYIYHLRKSVPALGTGVYVYITYEFQGAQPSGHGRPEGDRAFHMHVF